MESRWKKMEKKYTVFVPIATGICQHELRHAYRAIGTRALREIRYYQRKTHPVLRRRPFQMLVREIRNTLLV